MENEVNEASAAPIRKSKQSLSYVLNSLIAGGIAGSAAKTAVAPLDRLKIIFQTTSKSHTNKYSVYLGSVRGAFIALSRIYGEFGIRGLLQGHSATLFRIFPYAAIKFTSYEQFKSIIMKEKRSKLREFTCGSLSGMCSVFVTYPIEVLRVRLAVQLNKCSVIATIAQIYNQGNGKFFNFYNGFAPTILGMIPYAGFAFLTYEQCILISRKYYDILPMHAHLINGGVSGAAAQTISYPFEIIRRRMQVYSLVDVNYSTILKTINTIYSENGWRGFYVSLSIGYIKVIPMSMISFMVYEQMKNFLSIND
eukprot:NODE_100_length_20777_cov_0.240884.p6 type:complete len:308 gc:universal NODE_100_length_20777_cov_0.240884:7332-6409(-)